MDNYDEPDLELWDQCYPVRPFPWVIDGCHVRLVDGNAVKVTHDMDFDDSANGFRFPFIPKNEFWIEKKIVKGFEWCADLYHEAHEVRLMRDHGMSYDVAHEHANKAEKKLRLMYGS